MDEQGEVSNVSEYVGIVVWSRAQGAHTHGLMSGNTSDYWTELD